MDTQPLIDAISTGQVSLGVLIWVVVRLEQIMYRHKAHEARIAHIEHVISGEVTRAVPRHASGA